MQFILSPKHCWVQFKTHYKVLMFDFMLLFSQFYLYLFCHTGIMQIILFLSLSFIAHNLQIFLHFSSLHLRLTTGYKSFCSIDGLVHSISHINLEACVLSSLLYMYHWFCNFSNSFILPISATAVGSTSTSTDTTFF